MLSNAEFAILSLLSEAPQHGYGIERLVEQRGMRNWTDIGFSSIYFLLKKLEARGLVELEHPASTSRRSPKVYRLTEAGALAHREETRRALGQPEPLYPALLLGLANWPVLPPTAAAELLEARSVALDQKLRELQERRERQEPLPAFVRAMFDYSATMIAAERAWLCKANNMLAEAKVQKVDLKKAFKALYCAPAGEFIMIDVPPLNYFMIDGNGDPNKAPAYKEAIEALYAASYTLKFMSKNELSRDYAVPPLEGLWWAEDMSSFSSRQKESWSWRMMILVPDFIDHSMAERAIAAAAKKRALPGLTKLRFARLEEGQAVQTMHIGSYDEEGPILKRLHEEFLPANGLVEAGHHHEIYLSDPRKTAAEKLKTILRQPVRKRQDPQHA